MSSSERMIHARRGAAVVAIVLATLVLGFIMIGMVLAGARDQDLNVQRMSTLRAFYAGEGAANMAIRETLQGMDEDGDGGVGSISNDGNPANNPVIGGATVYATTAANAGGMTVSVRGSAGIATRKIDIDLQPGFSLFFGFSSAFAQKTVHNRQIATKVTLSEAGTLTTITAYVQGPSPHLLRYAVYADAGGEPGVLLVQSVPEAMGVNELHWHMISVPSIYLPAGDYWLALAFNQSNMYYGYDPSGGQSRQNMNDAVTDGFNTPWGASTASNSRRVNIYGTRLTENTSSITFANDGDYENSNPHLAGQFRDLTQAAMIQRGQDISANPLKFSALNFTTASGLVSNAVTAYDTDPLDANPTHLGAIVRFTTDVLVTGTSATRWIGVAGLVNGASSDGLAFTVKENGNSDRLQVTRLPQNGDISSAAILSQSNTFNAVGPNNWYRLVVDVMVANGYLQVNGHVYSHVIGADPTSAVDTSPLQSLIYSAAMSSLTGLQSNGQTALVFDSTDASSRGSMTNVRIDHGAGLAETITINTWSEMQP
jgi:hypothetical protein